MFYREGVKIVPKNIVDYLTLGALAYWLMDDGGRAGSRFLPKWKRKFFFVLQKEFSIRANFRKKYSKWLLHIPMSEMVEWKEPMEPHIIHP